MIENKKYASLKEIAEYLLVSQETIYNWIKKGVIPYYKIGRKYLFDPLEIDESIEKKAEKELSLILNDNQR